MRPPAPDLPAPDLADGAALDEAGAVAALVGRDPMFRTCIDAAGPLPPLVLRPRGFPGLVHIILEQQVSTAAARAMFAKLAALLPGLAPGDFLTLDDPALKSCGFSRPKAAYARGLATALIEGRLDLGALHAAPDAAAMAALTSLKGFGRWSAECYLLLHLGRPDLWPADDLAVQLGVQELRGLPRRPTRQELDALAESWRPYRSTAARLIWHWYVNARRRTRPAPSA
ncbi:DNA-3-methyladenine glycosylase family protein [Arenibaculum pallidiluteum]|uniref:DNA-3-methyladenine glycosylase family protein n=1 Tax=Arenibaculum pallidiluteum TaxID=2812559 RepID=UPI001A966B36|nr:DNA-3-methyladenine glycosylase 2 family protein [Arenibaculum pallidiluteum]